MKSWALAVGLSVAVHLGAVLMLGQVEVAASTPIAVPLAARGEVVSFTPVLEPEPVAPAPLKKVFRPVRVERSAPASPDETGVIALLGVPSSEAGDALPPETSDGPAVATMTGTGTDTASTPVAAPGPELIELVHARLASMADRCYPNAARRFQQRGIVKVSFCTDSTGGATNVVVAQSSGAELLDAAARGCVIEQAAPFPLEASSRCFSVPVRFGAR